VGAILQGTHRQRAFLETPRSCADRFAEEGVQTGWVRPAASLGGEKLEAELVFFWGRGW
jgi:hypothetical protein